MPCSGLERSLSPPWPMHGLPPRRRPCSTPSSRRHLRPSGSCSKPTIPLHSRGHEVRGARPGITSRSTWPPQLRASIMALTATPLDSPCFLFAARPTPPQHPAPPRMAPLTTSASSTSRCPAATASLPACWRCLMLAMPHAGDASCWPCLCRPAPYGGYNPYMHVYMECYTLPRPPLSYGPASASSATQPSGRHPLGRRPCRRRPKPSTERRSTLTGQRVWQSMQSRDRSPHIRHHAPPPTMVVAPTTLAPSTTRCSVDCKP
jgi:hypothetical protein